MILKTDCTFYKCDRPCIQNKTKGTVCSDCSFYKPIKFKILIVKLDAVGDVLRTTSILHEMKKKYPESHITWLTKTSSRELLINNEYVDEVLLLESHILPFRLNTQQFDLVFNPDASIESASLAAAAHSKVKKGFILDENGKSIPADENAVEWLEMGSFDYLKKQNLKTYQQVIHEIAGLDYNKGEIIISLTKEEKEFAKIFAEKHSLKKYKKIVGLNTGSSKRWQLKQWGVKKFEALILELNKKEDVCVLLYGGPDEREQNRKLVNLGPNVIDTGSDNSLREFFALVSLSDVFVTGDTLALHAATALQKKTIALFGPTSYNEIEDYGRIIKIYPEMDCLVCYLNKCDKSPNCMEMIKVEQILDLI